MSGLGLLGNVDYVLKHSNITRFAARLADNDTEFNRYVAALRRGRKN
jgi:hypothetical protein